MKKEDLEEIRTNNKHWLQRIKGMVTNFIKETSDGDAYLYVMHNNMSEEDRNEIEGMFGSVVFIKSGGIGSH